MEYKYLIKKILCNNIEPHIYLKQQDENEALSTIEELTDQLTSLVKSEHEEIKHLMATKQYTPTESHQLARGAAWFRLINNIDVKKARQLGFNSITTFRNEVFKRCLNEQTATTPLTRFKKGLITNERVLYRNAVAYKKEGIQCMVHAGAGNVNREKADTQAHAKIIELASNPVKFSWEDVAMMYNNWALAYQKEELTTSRIKQYLNTPKVKKVWFYARHGKLAADNVIQPIINRNPPSFPDALWSLDGSTMQLYYKDDQNKMRSDLYVVFVTDGHTGAVLGHSIGYAETAELVDTALRQAVITHENKPFQLQYDNSSANKAFVIQRLMDNMTRVHFPCEAYKGRSKYVEGIIGHLQQRELRKHKNFKGGNITSQSLNSKANPQLLAKFKKNPELLPNIHEVISQFNSIIVDYNNRGEKRDSFGRFIGDSKISRYTTIEHADRTKLNYFDRISLFMVQQKEPYTYGANGIIIDVKGKEYHFIVPDPDNVGDFIFSNENFGRKFKVRMDRNNPDLIMLYSNEKKAVFLDYAYEKERYASCAADMNDGSKVKSQLFKEKQERFGQDYSIKELERQMAILGELKATGTDGVGWWDTDKILNNLREGAEEDVLNGLNDGMTERQRRILSINK